MITLAGGNIQDGKGNLLNGFLTLQLTQDATVIASPGLVVRAIPLTFQFANGNLVGSCKCYSNAELTPGTQYQVCFADGNRSRLGDPTLWQFTQAAGSTVDIGTMVGVAAGVSFPAPVLLNPGAGVTQTISSGNVAVTGQTNLNGGGKFGGLWNKADPTTNSILQLEDLGTRNAQLIGFGVEQFLNPASSASYLNFGSVTELLIPTSNAQTFTGQQTGVYGDFINFGSGDFTAGTGFGGNFESFNAGPATALLIVGASATANNGGTVSGTPLPNQTPTNNGNVTNLRAFDGIAKNISSGTVTNGVAFYAESPINSGGGTFTNAYGLFVADMTAAVNNFAIKTGVGKVSIGDVATFNAPVGVGIAAAPNAGILVFSPGLTGTSQFGVQSAIQTSSAATAEGAGLIVRADTAAAAYTQGLNTGVHVTTPTVGSGSAITEWNGVRVDAGPTAGTKFAFKSVGTEPWSVGGKFGVYNAIATAGNGVASIHGATSQKSESAADANVLTFTPPAVAGTYRINLVLSVSAANAATLGWTATWTDSNGNAQTPTNLALSQTGVAAPALTFTTSAAGNYCGTCIIDTNGAAANIVIKLTFAGTSFTAKVTATVERLA